MAGLTIYKNWDTAAKIIAEDNEEGHALASNVLCGNYADADAAENMGMMPDPLSDEQEQHLRIHGWADLED